MFTACSTDNEQASAPMAELLPDGARGLTFSPARTRSVMWNWFSCYLSGRHSFGVSCEPGAIFLKCSQCGHGRPAGPWIRKATRRRRRQAHATGHHEGHIVLRICPRAPRPFPISTVARQASLRLTLCARAGDNTRRMAVPRITKEDLKQQLDGGASPPARGCPAEIPVRTQHGAFAGRHPVTQPDAAARRRSRRIVTWSCTTPNPNELSSSGVAATLIRQGYRAVALKGGIVEWLEAKLPTETEEAPQMAPPAPGALKG